MLTGSLGAVIDSNVNLNLGGARRNFNIGAAGLSQDVLQIDGPITSGQIDKVTGTGTLLLTNSGNSLGQNEVQTLTVGGTAGGTFTLTFRGQTTGPITNNSATLATDITTALQGLSTVGGAANLAVAPGTIANTFLITFTGALANRDAPTITTGNLTGGATASV